MVLFFQNFEVLGKFDVLFLQNFNLFVSLLLLTFKSNFFLIKSRSTELNNFELLLKLFELFFEFFVVLFTNSIVFTVKKMIRERVFGKL